MFKEKPAPGRRDVQGRHAASGRFIPKTKARPTVIEIPRSLARRLSAVLRSSIRKPYFPHVPLVDFHADAQGLCVRVAQGEVAVEYRQPGSFRKATGTLPLDALVTIEGRDESPVILEAGDAGQTVARWNDGGIPQVVAFEVPENAKRPKFPESPGKFISNPPALLTALAEAARSSAETETRYAMHRLLLRGKQGDVVGSDSKELYIHSGFTFGWTEDVLVPRVAAFARPEVGPIEAVEIGRSDQHVAVRFGPWTIFLGIDVHGKYPAVDMVIPRTSAATTVCRFAPGDAEFLLGSMPRLPGKADYNKPVTVDLNGHVSVRARAAGQPQITELVLSRSEAAGPTARLNLNRDHLNRALQLGFIELRVIAASKPLVCRDEHRTYLLMPLEPKDALPPAADALRIDSPTGTQPSRVVQPPRVKDAMSMPSTHDPAPVPAPVRRRAPARAMAMNRGELWPS
jgi:hypothetical protein